MHEPAIVDLPMTELEIKVVLAVSFSRARLIRSKIRSKSQSTQYQIHQFMHLSFSFLRQLQDAASRGILKAPLSMQLAIPLLRTRGPLFRQLYLGLREAILSGACASGEKLPSTRDLAEQLGISRTVVLLAYDQLLAEQLGISRTVVLLAYEQLLAEGFAVGRAGSGTYVSSGVFVSRPTRPEVSIQPRLSSLGSTAAAAWSAVNLPPRRMGSFRYDFAYGRSDLEIFPFEMWRRILLRCARKASVSELDYGPACGNLKLREAICAHLRRSRAVVSDPSRVID